MAQEIPESRSYIHTACGASTEVSGGDFEMMSNPFAGAFRAYCVVCQDFFPIQEFSWEDTGENIAESYQRLSSQASSLARICASRTAFFVLLFFGVALGIGVGAAAVVCFGWVLGSVVGVLAVIGGVLTSVILGDGVLTSWAIKSTFGVTDCRLVR